MRAFFVPERDLAGILEHSQRLVRLVTLFYRCLLCGIVAVVDALRGKLLLNACLSQYLALLQRNVVLEAPVQQAAFLQTVVHGSIFQLFWGVHRVSILVYR